MAPFKQYSHYSSQYCEAAARQQQSRHASNGHYAVRFDQIDSAPSLIMARAARRSSAICTDPRRRWAPSRRHWLIELKDPLFLTTVGSATGHIGPAEARQMALIKAQPSLCGWSNVFSPHRSSRRVNCALVLDAMSLLLRAAANNLEPYGKSIWPGCHEFMAKDDKLANSFACRRNHFRVQIIKREQFEGDSDREKEAVGMAASTKCDVLELAPQGRALHHCMWFRGFSTGHCLQVYYQQSSQLDSR